MSRPPGHPTGAAIRAGDAGAASIKQHLDLGVQTLLLPMIDTPEQAAHVVAATRYKTANTPNGIRGVAGGRASQWGRIADYAVTANEQMCVLVQIESQLGLDNLDAICAVEGVDGVFIGPSDLAASRCAILSDGEIAAGNDSAATTLELELELGLDRKSVV